MSVEKILIKTVESEPTSSGKDRWILNNTITVWSGGDAEDLSSNIGKALFMNIEEKNGWKTFKGFGEQPVPASQAPPQSYRQDATNDSIRRQCALKEARAFVSQLVTDKFIGVADIAVLVGMIDSITNNFELILNRQPPVLKEPDKQ